MPSRRQTFVRLTRALLACLVVFLAFEPPAPRVELTPPTAVVTAADAPARAPIVRRFEGSRAAAMRSLATLATIDERLVASSGLTPREPLLPARRLYVELRSLLC